MNSQFKEITFKSEAEFNEWLEKTTYKKIFFKDKGQDLMKITNTRKWRNFTR